MQIVYLNGNIRKHTDKLGSERGEEKKANIVCDPEQHWRNRYDPLGRLERLGGLCFRIISHFSS